MITLPKKFLSRYSYRARKILLETLKRPGTPAALDLLEELAGQEGALGAQLLAAYGITPAIIASVRGARTSPQETDVPAQPTDDTHLSSELKNVLKRATTLASQHQSIYIGTEHLLAALLEDKRVVRLLASESSRRAMKQLQEHLLLLLVHTSELSHLTPPRTEGMGRKHSTTSTPVGEKRVTREEQRVLPLFAEDLVSQAGDGLLDPLIGREEEVERLITILSRRTKNNPLLIGEAGVGKTAIVEGLAQRIQDGNVPEYLKEKRLLSLDLGLLIAGTVFRGEFEARLKDVIREAEEEHAILFIDEMHTLVGAGSAQGSLDAANMLKPAIASHELQIIGATTLDEYRTHLEKDPALERRLQPIVVAEPTADQTRHILKGLKSRFEEHHHVAIPDAVLNTAVSLADRYITQRCFPDKAIDVIDEAAAHMRATRTFDEKPGRDQLEQALTELQVRKEQAVKEEHYGEALILKHEEEDMIASLTALEDAGSEPTYPHSLSIENVQRVVSRMSGIPLEEIGQAEQAKLLNLEKELTRTIVGQDHAISVVAAALRRARAGVSSSARPVGSFLFVGPSGVGKSELAKTLAHTFFGRQDALIKLDMSEFSEQHTVSKLLGAPAGYVGYEDNGSFVERVRRSPYSLVLFDEIEKAHPVVHNLLLQILEDGELTDSKGVKVSFKNTLIVLTSNVGNTHFFDDVGRPGFGDEEASSKEEHARGDIKETFRPELLSRLDDVVVFKTLNAGDVEKIARRELKKLALRLKEKDIELSFDRSLIRHIAHVSNSQRYGARKVRLTVQNVVETEIAHRLIVGTVARGNALRLGARNGKLTCA